MRWTFPVWGSNGPKIGDTRKRAGFLWLPRCAKEEWRWLERAGWEQRFAANYHPGIDGYYTYKWEMVRWLPQVEEFPTTYSDGRPIFPPNRHVRDEGPTIGVGGPVILIMIILWVLFLLSA